MALSGREDIEEGYITSPLGQDSVSGLSEAKFGNVWLVATLRPGSFLPFFLFTSTHHLLQEGAAPSSGRCLIGEAWSGWSSDGSGGVEQKLRRRDLRWPLGLTDGNDRLGLRLGGRTCRCTMPEMDLP